MKFFLGGYFFGVPCSLLAVDVSRDSSMRPTNVDALTSSKYEDELHSLLSSSKPLDASNVADCLSGTGLGFYIPDVTGYVYITVTWINCLSHCCH